MNTKKCNKCGEIKPLAEFHKKTASKDGHQSQCKGCMKRYNEKNKAAKTEYDKRYNKKNKVAIAEWQKRYNEKNKAAIADYQKRYFEENKAAMAEYQKHYNKENKDAIAEQRKNRRATDPIHNLTCNIRVLIRNSFRNGGFSKKSKTASILGCSFDEFHQHIESQFTDGMSWQRMSDIHIDHRLPVSAATTEEEILVLNHHRNLQPMWAAQNLAKSDSYCPKELAAYFKKHLPT